MAAVRVFGYRTRNELAGSISMLPAVPSSKIHFSLVILGAGLATSIAMSAASAKPANTVIGLRAQCHREAGAYWNPGRRRWQYQGGIGTAQRQRFYDCLDRHHTQGR
jgi:hypothetical protein